MSQKVSQTNRESNFLFFGSSTVSVQVLDELMKIGVIPSGIVTNPPQRRGRGQQMTKSPVQAWAEKNGLPYLTPPKLDERSIEEIRKSAKKLGIGLFVVVAYGKILPSEILEIPTFGSVNLHYSSLPFLRGPSPVETAILNDMNPTGVTTILVDEKMDHGPILLQEEVLFPGWPVSRTEAFEVLNKIGARLLAKTISGLTEGSLVEQEQNHDEATYTKKFQKVDAQIDFSDDPYKNWLKILALEHLKPHFYRDGKRYVITKAHYKNGVLEIMRVIPEGKKEQDFNSQMTTPPVDS